MVNIFAIPKFRNYHVQTLSFSFLVYGFLMVFIVVFPFLAAFASENFWIRNDVLYETPIINFNNEMALYVLDSNDNTKFYSTIDQLFYNYPNEGRLTPPVITYTLVDSNHDDITEKLIYQLTWTDNSENIKAFKFMLFFEYGFIVSLK